MIKIFLFILFFNLGFYFLFRIKSYSTDFYYVEIPADVKSRIIGNSYKENSDIILSDLVYVKVLYIVFDDMVHYGELIVNRKIADDVVDIFKELYLYNYKIEKMVLIDDYNALNDYSRRDNNTSAFNYCNMDCTNKLSKHSLGLAIDINPLYNPYVKFVDDELIIRPSTAFSYVDREKDFKSKIVRDDICYKAFVKRGFIWGGEWNLCKDYQHFEKDI